MAETAGVLGEYSWGKFYRSKSLYRYKLTHEQVEALKVVHSEALKRFIPSVTVEGTHP
jgi:hypothetical protein